MKLLSLLFVFRMMHVAVCSCRLRRVRRVRRVRPCVCMWIVGWLKFSWNSQFVVENFTFLFPLDKYFSFTMKWAPRLALSAKLKNKPKLNESSTWWSNEWTSMVLKSLKSPLLNRMSAPKMLMLDNQQALCSIMCNTKDSTQFLFFFILQTTNPIIRLKNKC